jgi:hypothetical protein
MRDHAAEVLAFTVDPSIPSANNGASVTNACPGLHEITGGFRNLANAQAWA